MSLWHNCKEIIFRETILWSTHHRKWPASNYWKYTKTKCVWHTYFSLSNITMADVCASLHLLSLLDIIYTYIYIYHRWERDDLHIYIYIYITLICIIRYVFFLKCLALQLGHIYWNHYIILKGIQRYFIALSALSSISRLNDNKQKQHRSKWGKKQ